MSEQSPTPRRKIAGERRRGRPVESEVATAGAAEHPIAAVATPAIRRPRRDRPAPASDGSGTPPAAAARASAGHVPNWLLIGLAVLLAAAVVFDLIFGFRSKTAAAERTSSSAAVASALKEAPVQAETAAVRALAFDYKTLQTDANEAKTFMTPEYAAKFQKTVDELLNAPAQQRKAHVEADVKASGVITATASKVDVMLFVDQTSQTTLQSTPQTYLNRVVFTMVKSGNGWLVSDVTAL